MARRAPARITGARRPVRERTLWPWQVACSSVQDVTVKLVVLYTKPSDPGEFDQHYLGTHMPLVSAIPGLLRAETGRIDAALDGGEQTYYRVAELYFADQAALQDAFASQQGQATAADYQQIAPPGSRMFTETLDD
jgi:uncharacterized protein (TIGR02118 family)